MSLLPTFTTLGAGATVLLLHDADGGHLTFAPQVETLARHGYRAVAWDMPGYGRSAPVEPYSLKALAGRCMALVAALHAPAPVFAPITLVGHGLGAMLALEVALRQPARVRRLVLCAGGPVLDAAARQCWLAPRLRALGAGQGMAALAQALVLQCIGPGALPEGAQLAAHALAQVYTSTYHRALAALAAFDRSAAALGAVLHMPVLLVGGAHDRCMPPAALQALAAALPEARHLTLPGVGHWPQLEDPDGFDAALLDFLAQQQRTVH